MDNYTHFLLGNNYSPCVFFFFAKTPIIATRMLTTNTVKQNRIDALAPKTASKLYSGDCVHVTVHLDERLNLLDISITFCSWSVESDTV